MAEINGVRANLRSELCAYYEWGLAVRIDEELCKTEDVNNVCQVLEDSHYMRDYEEDDRGQIRAVNFTRIDR